MTSQIIDFKHPRHILHGLDTALRQEKRKYSQCPVGQDMMPMQDALNAWGYVVAGYFLVEMSFKALLHMHNKQVERKHSLTIPFCQFDTDDKELLCEFYTDYRATIPNGMTFPFSTLDEFLTNLDGDLNNRGTDFVGSFDWRYLLVEEKHSQKMPFIGIEFLHEIAYGCIRMIAFAHNRNEDPSRCTRSWRLRWDRTDKYNDWLLVQAHSGEHENLDGKLAILWGPDYRDRYDMALFRRNGNPKSYFAELPPDEFSLPIVDKRKELEEFDADEGFRSIGISVRRPTAD